MTDVSVELRSTVGVAALSPRFMRPPPPAQPARASVPMSAIVTPENLGCMRLVPGRMGGREHGHADSEMGSRIFAVDDFNGAAMGVDELEYHRQANAGALDLHAGGRTASVERFEHASAFIGRNTGAGVGDIDHELGVLFRGM